MVQDNNDQVQVNVIGIGEEWQDFSKQIEKVINQPMVLLTSETYIASYMVDSKSKMTFVLMDTDREISSECIKLIEQQRCGHSLCVAVLKQSDSLNEKAGQDLRSLFDSVFFVDDNSRIITIIEELYKFINLNGYINIDLAHVKVFFEKNNSVVLVTTVCKGADRAMKASHKILSDLAKGDNCVSHPKSMLVNVYSNKTEATMVEISEILDNIIDFYPENKLDTIWGTALDSNLEDEICLTVLMAC